MKSLWCDTATFKERGPLTQNISAGAVVIGAGIAGILTAYMLQKVGKSVVVLERGRALSGVTKYTSAKITSQHNLIYSRLIRELGESTAGLYARANQGAIKKYAEIIAAEAIECDFEEKDAFVYSLKDTSTLHSEIKAAKKLGIDACFAENIPLPFKTAGAVCFHAQAQFNPLKFLQPLADNLTIFENCRVVKVSDGKIKVDNNIISAENVIIATHYPIIDVPGYYFARLHQSRSYFIAVTGAADVGGMYIADDEKYSFRNYKNFLLLGGKGHRTGENRTGGAYSSLAKSAEKWYPECSVQYSWSAQDCMPADGVPYIGRYAASTPNMYVATGFQKWGMTSAMLSAEIITNLITCGKSEYEKLFSPQRFNVPASVKQLADNSAHAVGGLFKSAVQAPKALFDEIHAGHGGIVKYEGEKIGVYKSRDGEVFAVDVKCPHMGCQLEWNPDDLTWECPCHGSRFSFRGELLNSPAIRDIN